MSTPATATAGLMMYPNEYGQRCWRLTDAGDDEWTPQQPAAVEAAQTGLGRCRVTTLPDSPTATALHTVHCNLTEVTVALTGDDIVVHARGEELTRVTTRICSECGVRVAEWHVTGVCRCCEEEGGGCAERHCPICYPLSWRQADEPMRYWTVIFELTWDNGTLRVDDIEAHNEAEAEEEALREAFPDYDEDEPYHFRTKNIRHSHVIETVGG